MAEPVQRGSHYLSRLPYGSKFCFNCSTVAFSYLNFFGKARPGRRKRRKEKRQSEEKKNGEHVRQKSCREAFAIGSKSLRSLPGYPTVLFSSSFLLVCFPLSLLRLIRYSSRGLMTPTVRLALLLSFLNARSRATSLCFRHSTRAH